MSNLSLYILGIALTFIYLLMSSKRSGLAAKYSALGVVCACLVVSVLWPAVWVVMISMVYLGWQS